MRTFEELAAAELDNLYQGALFLEGGDEVAAERLLVDTLTDAFDRYRSERPEDGVGWLACRLVTAFMVGEPLPEGPSRLEATLLREAAPFGDLDARNLYRAAAAVPAAARAALWLVLLQRWSYAAAAAVVGVERDVLVELLRYGHVLMAATLGGHGDEAGHAKAN